jgi:hypothetical protein
MPPSPTANIVRVGDFVNYFIKCIAGSAAPDTLEASGTTVAPPRSAIAPRNKLVAFVLSAVIAGLAGAPRP